MEVLKSILPKRNFTGLIGFSSFPYDLNEYFLGSLRQVLGSRDPIIFLALLRHMEMLIRMNINFFRFE